MPFLLAICSLHTYHGEVVQAFMALVSSDIYVYPVLTMVKLQQFTCNNNICDGNFCLRTDNSREGSICSALFEEGLLSSCL